MGILRVEVRASTRLVSYFRTTRSLPDVNAIAHSRNFRTGNKTCILSHITRVYAMYATITVVINLGKRTCTSSLVGNGELDVAVI